MKKTPANGITGHLLYNFDGTYSFRVYGADHTFEDYKLLHCDLMVTIVDADSTLYKDDNGNAWLDHCPETLGHE